MGDIVEFKKKEKSGEGGIPTREKLDEGITTYFSEVAKKNKDKEDKLKKERSSHNGKVTKQYNLKA